MMVSQSTMRLFPSTLLRLPKRHLLCRGCLHPLTADSEAGLCGACWAGLLPLDEGRCVQCAVVHNPDSPCPDPVAWTFGDALWQYHGGRPALGAMLLPGIKDGERSWKDVLLKRFSQSSLPAFCSEVDFVTSVPTVFHRRWMRGFDLAEELGRLAACRLGRPFQRSLQKNPWTRRQVGRTATDRRTLRKGVITVRSGTAVREQTVLLVDDVWTTGTTLLRCAQALQAAGAREVRVFTLFRA